MSGPFAKLVPGRSAASLQYRCRRCEGVIDKVCNCGAVTVSAGWYATKILWASGVFEEAVEVLYGGAADLE